MTDNIVKQLGPAVEVQVKLKLPAAFLEYIQKLTKQVRESFFKMKSEDGMGSLPTG
jgi:hypothetical protein